MSKSKYPNKIDTSIELPTVRDNILQAGSEAINSLRSAIIQIEKTLGINPQGEATQTLAQRLERSLDLKGNIKKDSLNLAGVLTGPISDKDVSQSAKIKEEKLDLEYSTSFLNTKLSSTISKISEFSALINDISSKLSIHINQNAQGSHLAKNINVEELTGLQNAISFKASQFDNLQNILKGIVSGHINYSGANISETNNSHTANQIYYNSTNSGISSSNVQDAITEAASIAEGVLTPHQATFHSNCVLDKSFKNSNTARKLAQNVGVSYLKYSAASDKDKTRISLNTPIEISELEIGDVVLLNDLSEKYTIYDIKKSGSLVSYVDVYGNILTSSLSLSTADFEKNILKENSISSFRAMSLNDPNLTSNSVLKFANPDSTHIISDYVRYSEINSSNKEIVVEVDQVDYTINVYDSSATKQTIEVILNKISEQVSENNIPLTFFRLNFNDGSKIGISYDIPNTATSLHYIKIKRSDGAIDSLGFSQYENISIYGDYDNAYVINGEEKFSFPEKLNTKSMIIVDGTNQLSVSQSAFSPLGLNIKKNDIIYIINSSSNDGAYLVESASDGIINLNLKSGQTLNLDSSLTTDFIVYRNSIGFSNLDFSRLTSTGFGSVLLSVFIDQDREINFVNNLEYENILLLTEGQLGILDYSGNISEANLNLTVDLVDPLDTTKGILVRLNDYSPIKFIDESDVYFRLYSDRRDLEVLFYLKSAQSIASSISGTGSKTIAIEPTSSIPENVLLLGNFNYDSFTGNITGSSLFKPLFKAPRGSISLEDLSQDAVEALSVIPFKDSRYNGVIFGAEVSNPLKSSNGFYSFDITAGVCYVQGERITVKESKSIETDILVSASTDKIFVAIDSDGTILFRECLPSCTSPFSTKEYCVLSTIEFNVNNILAFDLRLFIDNLDLKILNDIKVSPEVGAGHFTSINKAIAYAKRFSEVFKNSKIPTISLKSGEYNVSITHSVDSTNQFSTSAFNKITEQGVWLDFPVTITGEGDSTVLNFTNIWTDTTSDSKYTNKDNRGAIYIAGPGQTTLPSNPGFSRISSGKITIKDLKLKNSRIYVIDPVIESGGDKLEVSYEVSNVTFDGNPDSGTPTEFDRYCLYVKELNSSTLLKGNLKINNSSFQKTSIFLEGSNSDFRNINITSNDFYCLDVSKEALISQNDTTALIAGPDEGTQIYIYGNAHRTTDVPASQRLAAGYSSPATITPLISNLWTSVFSSDLRVRGGLRVSDNIIGNYIQILDSSSTSSIDGDEIYLSNASASTGVVVRSDLEVQGDLTTSGSVFGRDYANVNLTLKTLSAFCVGDFSYSSSTSIGGASFSAVMSSSNSNNVLNVPYDAGVKKIMLRNLGSGSIGGFLRIYKIDSGLDTTVSTNYTLVDQSIVLVGSYGIQNLTISDSILIDAGDSIVFIFEKTTGTSTLFFANAIMMYDIT
ncbi:hypothetical protein N9W84_00270 [bacterium]|nr:hypothetical protein [bacterium]